MIQTMTSINGPRNPRNHRDAGGRFTKGNQFARIHHVEGTEGEAPYSREATTACSPGREPGDNGSIKMVEPRSGGSAEDDQRHTELLPPLLGSGRPKSGDRGFPRRSPTATCLGHSVARTEMPPCHSGGRDSVVKSHLRHYGLNLRQGGEGRHENSRISRQSDSAPL